MIRVIQPRLVRKAKRPSWKSTRSPARLNALKKAMKGAVKIDFNKGVERFKKRVNKEAVYQAWMSGNYDAIRTQIPFKQMPEDLGGMTKTIGAGYGSFGKAGIELLPPPIIRGLRYDVENPRIERFLSTRTAELVTSIERDAETVIQSAVRASFTQALNPKRVADRIVGSIGLTPQYSGAVSRYQEGLIAEGMPEERAAELALQYESRLLDSRALNIARTETAYARNYGQLYVWQDAENQGLISPESKKVWNLSDDACDICAPMDGISVGLAEAWTLDDGDVVDVPNETHPNCECYMTIDLGDTEDRFQEVPEYQHGYGEGE